VAAIDEVAGLMTTLREGWANIKASTAPKKVEEAKASGETRRVNVTG